MEGAPSDAVHRQSRCVDMCECLCVCVCVCVFQRKTEDRADGMSEKSVRVCSRVRVCACVRTGVCMYVGECVLAWVYGHAWSACGRARVSCKDLAH